MTNIQQRLTDLFEKELKPQVRSIDAGFYPKELLTRLGEEGYFSSEGEASSDYLQRELDVVAEASRFCMTTGFLIWCHLAALTYMRKSENDKLKKRMLSRLENGSTLAGTGLSNPMKYYAGLETLHLQAAKVDGGYVVNGTLPSVSNLDQTHWFGAIAEVNADQRVMLFVSCAADGLTRKAKTNYLGINGSGTYACHFDDVFISEEDVLAEDADCFIKQIRPDFLAYQIPLGFGVTKAALASIERYRTRQGGCNQFLPLQPEAIQAELEKLQTEVVQLASRGLRWEALLPLRKRTATLTIEAVHTAMLHGGGAAYLNNSPEARRLREAYFLVNLTPTIKHLEKMLTV